MKSYEFNPYILLANHVIDEEKNAGASLPLRYTIYHELEIITGGSGQAYVNDVEYKLHYGDVFYRVPGMKTQYFSPFRSYLFVFEPYFTHGATQSFPYDVVNGLPAQQLSSRDTIEPFDFATPPFMGHMNDPGQIIKRANNIYANFCSDQPDILRLRGDFLLFVDDISKALNPKPTPSLSASRYAHYNSAIKTVELAVLNRLNQKWSLTDAAKIAELSPNFFSKVFHTVKGVTFTEYVQQAKLKHAVVLLIDSNMSISQISDYLCFCDATYFQTLFKKYTGVPPMKFRNLVATNGANLPDS